jgi:hypothetical protein
VPYAGKKVTFFKSRIKFEELEDMDSDKKLVDGDSHDNILLEIED